ncbi:hypothetical protein CLOP_g11123 [Closterium sp. NIES-67]|nr:hypothetical protein CLOP_g11123 [Closterium sp. NIES-67]
MLRSAPVIVQPSPLSSTTLRAQRPSPAPYRAGLTDHVRQQYIYKASRAKHDAATAAYDAYQAALAEYARREGTYITDLDARHIADRCALTILLATIPPTLKQELAPTSSGSSPISMIGRTSPPSNPSSTSSRASPWTLPLAQLPSHVVSSTSLVVWRLLACCTWTLCSAATSLKACLLPSTPTRSPTCS